MDRAEWGSPPAQPATHLHEASRVTCDQAPRTRRLHVRQLLVEDRGGDLRQAHRERAAEAAALVAGRQLHELGALEPAQDRPRRLPLAEAAPEMTGVVVRHPRSEEHTSELQSLR